MAIVALHSVALTRAHQGREPSRCDGGVDPGLQVARMEVFVVAFVAEHDTFRPLNADARAKIGENEASAVIAAGGIHQHE